MRRMLLVSAIAALVACCAASAIAADDEAVLLRYKFEADKEVVQELTGSGTVPMTLDLPEQAGGQKKIETSLDMEMDLSQKCDKVEEDGSGHLLVTIPFMLTETTTKADGQSQFTVMSWEDGEMVITVNGKEIEDPKTLQMLSAFSQGFKMTMKPNGETKMDEEPTKQMAGLLQASGMGGLDFTKLNFTSRLPEAPVKPGDTWKSDIKVPAGEEGEISAVTEMKYIGIEEVDGIRCARIEGKATMNTTGEMPAGNVTATPVQMKLEKMTIDVEFVLFFDLAKGEAAKTTMDLVENMDMCIIAPGGPDGAQLEIPGVIEDAQIHIEILRK